MKRFFAFFTICSALTVATAGFCFAGDRHINKNELPRQARAFLTAHYGQTGISYATVDREAFDTTYDVSLADGTKLEFSKNGNILEIKSPRGGSVPASAIPDKIAAYITRNYPKATVSQMEIDGRLCEVLLSNGVEITFNKQGEMVRSTDYNKHRADHRFTLRE